MRKYVSLTLVMVLVLSLGIFGVGFAIDIDIVYWVGDGSTYHLYKDCNILYKYTEDEISESSIEDSSKDSICST